MSWDSIWENVYRGRAWGRYPPEELIRFVARHYYGVPDRKTIRILEIGCGAGANLWYLAREGFDAYGLDGSWTAIRKARDRLIEEEVAASLQVGEAVSYYRPATINAVVDVCCLQHNRAADATAIIDQIGQVLKPGGRVFSMMVAVGSWGEGLGTEIEPGCYTDIPEGPAAGLGLTRFVTHCEAMELFRDFRDVEITMSRRTMNGLRNRWSHWVIEGRKDE